MSPRTRKTLQAVVGIGLAVALLVWGLPYFAKTTWGDIWDVIATIPLSHAVGFQLLMLLGLWCYTFTFTGSLPGLTHSKALIVNLCGSSVSNLLPGGGAVGLAATYAICRSWGFSRRATSTSVVVTGVWNVLARIALPVIAIAVLWFSGVTLPGSLTDLAVAGMVTGRSDQPDSARLIGDRVGRMGCAGVGAGAAGAGRGGRDRGAGRPSVGGADAGTVGAARGAGGGDRTPRCGSRSSCATCGGASSTSSASPGGR